MRLNTLMKRVADRMPSSVTPETRMEIHPSEWLTLVDEIARLQHALRRASHYLDWAAFHHVTAKGAQELLRTESLAAWPEKHEADMAELNERMERHKRLCTLVQLARPIMEGIADCDPAVRAWLKKANKS